MNIKAINKIIKEIKETNCNFVIKTNIARGRGINGVSYETYYGYTTADDEILRTTIVDAKTEENYIEIYTDNTDVSYPFANGGQRRIFIDANSIVSIELIERTASSLLPEQLPKK